MDKLFTIHISNPNAKPFIRIYDLKSMNDALAYISISAKILGIAVPICEVANDMRDRTLHFPIEIHHAINEWADQIQECEANILEAGNNN